MIDLQNHQALIKTVCAELGVQRLDLFGSAAGPQFGPSSDVDVLARLDRTRGKMFDRYFDLKERLEKIFSRPVDLVLEDSIQNPYFCQAVERSRVKIYEA